MITLYNKLISTMENLQTAARRLAKIETMSDQTNAYIADTTRHIAHAIEILDVALHDLVYEGRAPRLVNPGIVEDDQSSPPKRKSKPNNELTNA
jgi:hypothetical protein